MGFLSKLFGGGGATFTLPDREARARIDELSTFGKSPVTGPSEAGKLTLQDLQTQQQRAQEQQAELESAGVATGLSNLALFGGGASAGSAERLARQGVRSGVESRQGLFGEFGQMRTQALAADLANEQKRKDAARMAALQGELNLLGARTSAELGRAGMAAQRSASKKALFGSIATGLGYAFGGPLGGAAAGTAATAATADT